MAKIDKAIRLMMSRQGKSLVLETSMKPYIEVDAKLPISGDVLGAEEIDGLVAEIQPPPAPGSGTPPARFAYRVDDTELDVERHPSHVVFRPRQPARAPDAPQAARAAEPPALETLLRLLVERGGSDLHLSSGHRPVLRIDGSLQELHDWPVFEAGEIGAMLMPIASERCRVEFERTNDTDFSHEIRGLARLRCNVFRDRRGPGAVFRVIPSTAPTMESMALPQAVRRLCQLPSGLVLVTGPTGSGKSTTLASMIRHINETRSDHVVTIEDPIEFVHESQKSLVNQREVHVHTEGFAEALRAALREDPDVILVGEMRDLETTSVALETAETGHLVFATLHTNGAVATVDRLINQFPPERQEQVRMSLSASLRAVLSQVLCRKRGGGRVMALELLVCNAAVANLIREGKAHQLPSAMQTNKRLGMQSLLEALLRLVETGQIDPEEAYLRANDKGAMRAALSERGIRLELDDGDTEGGASATRPTPTGYRPR